MKMTTTQLISAILAYAGFGAIAVTVIGYFDEGTNKLYSGFGEYLANEAYPPMLDYVFWVALAIVLGFIALIVIDKNSQVQTISSWWKIAISILVIPFAFAIVVMAFMGIFSILNQAV